jgi:hypothetical protein
MLRTEWVEEKFGRLDRSVALADVIKAFQGGTPAPASSDDQEGHAPHE